MNDSRKFVKISTTGEAEVIEIPKEDFLNMCYREIGCEYIEICTPCPDIGLRMIVDDCGKFNDQRYNALATLLYNRPDIIFGDVIVGMEGVNDDGEPDIIGIPKKKLDEILLTILALI